MIFFIIAFTALVGFVTLDNRKVEQSQVTTKQLYENGTAAKGK